MNRDLRAHINATIPGLRNGIDDEIAQQTWVHLVPLDRRRIRRSRDVVGLAKWFLRSYAIREVFDGYTPPGRKKRTRLALDEPARVSLDAEIGDGYMTVREILASTRADERVDLCDLALARMALSRAARTAPRFVAQALALVYLEGLSINAAAGRVGVDHKTLERAIARWAAAEGLHDGSGPARGGPKTVAPQSHSSGRTTDRAQAVPGNSQSHLVRVA